MVITVTHGSSWISLKVKIENYSHLTGSHFNITLNKKRQLP
jgi:hypothetical protein